MWILFKVIQNELGEFDDDEHGRRFDALREYRALVARLTNLVDSERTSPLLDIHKWQIIRNLWADGD